MKEQLKKINPYLEEEQAKQLKNVIENMQKKVRKHFSKEKELFTPVFNKMREIINGVKE